LNIQYQSTGIGSLPSLDEIEIRQSFGVQMDSSQVMVQLPKSTKLITSVASAFQLL
jgi:hypothetical protein